MNEQGIPRRAAAFIAEHIDSVMQLEVLLLLHADAARAFSSADVGSELRIDSAWVEGTLRGLCARHVLSCTSDDKSLYRYAATGETDAAVAELARAYADRRVTVIGLIFAKPTDKIRSFADAFRLRKEKDKEKGDG